MSDPVLGPTIEQLRANCPPLGGNVAGAADFQKGLQNYNTNMVLPAAYVVPLDQEAETGPNGLQNQQMVGLWEIIDKTIGVIVELDATSDRRGQGPAMQYDVIEAALFAAMLNWSPVTCRVPNNQGFYFRGGRFLDLDRARLFYQWEFGLRYQITDEDGWQASTPEDLIDIELDIYKQPTELPLPPADGTPPSPVVVIPTDQPPFSREDLHDESEARRRARPARSRNPHADETG
jgi:hypothetical protein